MDEIVAKVEQPYSPAKTVATGLKPVAGIMAVKYGIDYIGVLTNHPIPEKISMNIAVGIFGLYRMLRNYMKNKSK